MGIGTIGLIINMTGSILVGVEFIGIERVQRWLDRFRKFSSLTSNLQSFQDVLESPKGRAGVLGFLVLAHATTALEITYTNLSSLLHSLHDIHFVAVMNQFVSWVYLLIMLILLVKMNLSESMKSWQKILTNIAFILLFLWPYLFIFYQSEPYYYYINFFSLWLPFMYLLLSSLAFIVLPPISWLFRTVGLFYKEDAEDQLQILGATGLALLIAGFSLQLVARL